MIWIEYHRLDDGGYPGLETEMSKVNLVQVGQIFIYKVPSCQNDAAPMKIVKNFCFLWIQSVAYVRWWGQSLILKGNEQG